MKRALRAKDIPAQYHKRILSRNRFCRNNRLTPRRQSPPAGSKSPVQDAPVLDLRKVHNPVRLHLYVLGGDGSEQHVGGFFGEGIDGETMEGARPVDSFARLIYAEQIRRRVVQAGC